jgi:hypothetical protein
MTEIRTGIDAIRQALRARKLNFSNLARDLHLPTAQFEAFMDGGPLPTDALEALTKLIWAGHAEFVPELNLLRPANRQEARPLGGPPPITETMTLPKTMPKFTAGPRLVEEVVKKEPEEPEQEPEKAKREPEKPKLTWYGHPGTDPEQQEARPLGSGPPPIDPATLPKFKGGPPGPGPQPVTPAKAEPEKPRRPGWVE